MLVVLVSALAIIVVLTMILPPAMPAEPPLGPCVNEGLTPKKSGDPDFSGYFCIDTGWRIWSHCNKCGYDACIGVSPDDFITNEDLRHPQLPRGEE